MTHVSVVIPCFNAGPMLVESVRSALAQSYADLDVVIVDDGSTDQATEDALGDVARWDRVAVHRQANGGPSAALNTAIRAASGPYILPLGADDVIAPEYVAEAVPVLDSRPEVGLVYCRAEFFGSISGPWRLAEFSWPQVLVHNMIFVTSLYRKSDWESAGGYDEGMRGREDHDFILRMLSLGLVPHRLEGVYFFYRRGHHTTVNDAVGADRRILVEASARMMRNNLPLYGEHAEDLFTYIFRQQDEINDLRYRYAWFERIRDRYPGVLKTARKAKSGLRGLLAR